MATGLGPTSRSDIGSRVSDPCQILQCWNDGRVGIIGHCQSGAEIVDGIGAIAKIPERYPETNTEQQRMLVCTALPLYGKDRGISEPLSARRAGFRKDTSWLAGHGHYTTHPARKIGESLKHDRVHEFCAQPLRLREDGLNNLSLSSGVPL